ncbi:hypothetical protein BD779DRAFT_1401571, partial [Infundibulicybe gibba]
GRRHKFILRGIVYFGSSHFTSRILTEEGMLWYHDGINTGKNTECEGPLSESIDLLRCEGREATAAIYSQL